MKSMTSSVLTDKNDTMQHDTATQRHDEVMDFLDQMYRDIIRTETRLCRIAIALGQGHVLHRDQEAAK